VELDDCRPLPHLLTDEPDFARRHVEELRLSPRRHAL
jgi:hypothetical protein